MGISVGHILLVLIIVFVLFGAGKLPQVMSELAKGLKAFKKGIDGADDVESAVQPKLNSAEKKTKDVIDQAGQHLKEDTTRVKQAVEKGIQRVNKPIKKATAQVKRKTESAIVKAENKSKATNTKPKTAEQKKEQVKVKKKPSASKAVNRSKNTPVSSAKKPK